MLLTSFKDGNNYSSSLVQGSREALNPSRSSYSVYKLTSKKFSTNNEQFAKLNDQNSKTKREDTSLKFNLAYFSYESHTFKNKPTQNSGGFGRRLDTFLILFFRVGTSSFLVNFECTSVHDSSPVENHSLGVSKGAISVHRKRIVIKFKYATVVYCLQFKQETLDNL